VHASFHIEHFLVAADDIDATRDWYARVLGMKSGPHPDFGFPVHWMYLGDVDIVHIGPSAKMAGDIQKKYLGRTSQGGARAPAPSTTSRSAPPACGRCLSICAPRRCLSLRESKRPGAVPAVLLRPEWHQDRAELWPPRKPRHRARADGVGPYEGIVISEEGPWTKLQRLSLVALLTVGTSCSVAADFPTKPIRLVVAVPARGTLDILARGVGPELTARLGQPVVIDNRPGATVRSPPNSSPRASAADGHTLLIGGGSGAAVHALLRPEFVRSAEGVRAGRNPGHVCVGPDRQSDHAGKLGART
jgi:catechol 2,3-dioxygenase-like lactoylglutathione lyase family enzyme